MNPNSQNQMWSKWTFTVTQSKPTQVPFEVAKANLAKFGRRKFGSASQMHITQEGLHWTVEVRTEGHPVHDPEFVSHMEQDWRAFLWLGFGLQSDITCSVKLEAGSRQDGTPADQLIILPPISFDLEALYDR
jgi:hypothetical protein